MAHNVPINNDEGGRPAGAVAVSGKPALSVNDRVRKVAVAGVLSSLVIVLGITGIGFIRLPGLALTVVHLPVILGAILEGPVVGAGIGLLFGVFSIIQAALAGGAEGAAFVNPLVSVLPRLFIGPAAWLVYRLISGKGKPGRFREIAAIALGAFTGSIVNTALVLSALAFFFNEYFPPAVLLISGLTNGPVEAALSLVLITAVVSAWRHIPRGGRSRLSRENASR